MARGFITSVFLYFMSITMVYATGVVCSAHNDSRSDCNNEPGCRVIEAQNANNNFFCIPNCQDFDQTECKNYAGCALTDMGACDPSPANKYPLWETDHFEYYPCPSDYPSSKARNDSIDFCYKPCTSGSDAGTNECGVYQATEWNNVVSCFNTNTLTLIPSDDFHIEGDKCFLNARPCNLFSAKDESSNPINAALITGTAIWLPTEQKYQVSDTNNADNTCTYSVTGIQYADKHCTANITYTNNTQWVANASSELNFQTVNGYYCTSCINTYPTYYYYPSSNTDVDDCVNPGNNHSQVCLCKIVPRGYYLNGIWNYTSPIPSNRYTKCPVGQTTMNGTSPNYSGGGSINDCQYEDDTQVCDVAGCKSLNQILSGAAANAWTSMLP